MHVLQKGLPKKRDVLQSCGNLTWQAFYPSGTFSAAHPRLWLRRAGANGQTQGVRRWYILVLGAILIGGGVYIYLHRQDLGLGPSLQTDTDQSPRPANIQWATMDRSAEGFRVDMPLGTREVQVPAYNPTGGEEQVEMVFSDPDSATSYSVAWKDDPPVERSSQDNPQQILNNARDGALTRTQTVLVSQSAGNRQGYPILDFQGRNEGGGIFNARLLLAGRRLYLLMAAFPAASARRDADVSRFFDSFQIMNPPRGG
jgi:hypothetical protein